MNDIERSVFGGSWHGPSLMELLTDVTAEQAIAHPVAAAHSIWEMTVHAAIWMELSKQAIDGHAIPPSHGFHDWVATDGTWNQARQRLAKAGRELADAFADADPDEIVPGRHYNFEHLLAGVAQHNTYHAGQISMLKKLL
ncbi:MAG: DinB family protein [Acidobacteria bacterium]|nr:DinB family protein [Acidobacteriota bacterium]